MFRLLKHPILLEHTKEQRIPCEYLLFLISKH
jgi:hypothetical protein